MYWHVDCFSFRSTTEERSVDLSFMVKERKRKDDFPAKLIPDIHLYDIRRPRHTSQWSTHNIERFMMDTLFVSPCVRLSLYWPYRMVSQRTVTVTYFLWWYQIHMEYATPKHRFFHLIFSLDLSFTIELSIVRFWLIEYYQTDALW